MTLRSYAHRVAILAAAALLAGSASSAVAGDCQDLAWSKDQLSKFDAAIASDAVRHPASATQVSEIDAAIASLEQDLASRKGEAAARGQVALNDIRAARDASRSMLPQLAAAASTAGAQGADSRQPREAAAFWGKVNAYLDAVNADIPTRQAANQTRFLGN